jgi:uncharacterized protein (TIGR02145 family)
MRLSIFYFALVLLFGVVSCQKEEKEKPLETGMVSDAEGNSYKTVLIGGKWWMAENLKSSKLNDGTALTYIPLSKPDSVWSNSMEPSYTYLNDSIYGCLYNQAAVQSLKKLAPAGWHVATDEDWKSLERFAGMAGEEVENLAWRGSNEAELLLPAYSEGWPTSSVPFGNDKFQMKILPAGCILFNGISSIEGMTAFFWTATLKGSEAWYRYFDSKKKSIFRHYTHTQYGMSIRCVKD